MTIYKLTISGDPKTKKNSQNVVFIGQKCPVCHKGQRAIPMKSEAYRKYESEAKKQIVPPNSPISKKVNIRCEYYMKTQRKVDLANLLEATDDILVAAKVIEDDNSTIIASHDGSCVRYDKDNPRCVITITELQEEI